MELRALRRMIELMQAQINRAEVPDAEEAKKKTEEEYKEYEEKTDCDFDDGNDGTLLRWVRGFR
jgi:hypothetical protein